MWRVCARLTGAGGDPSHLRRCGRLGKKPGLQMEREDRRAPHLSGGAGGRGRTDPRDEPSRTAGRCARASRRFGRGVHASRLLVRAHRTPSPHSAARGSQIGASGGSSSATAGLQPRRAAWQHSPAAPPHHARVLHRAQHQSRWAGRAAKALCCQPMLLSPRRSRPRHTASLGAQSDAMR